MSILEVDNVSKSFGGVKANVDISMTVEKGKIFGLIGPNGSGKTTLFNSIVGTYPIDNGSIKFNAFRHSCDSNSLSASNTFSACCMISRILLSAISSSITVSKGVFEGLFLSQPLFSI